MKLKTLDQELSVCKVVSISDIDLNGKFFFVGKTDEEISLVCLTSDVPDNTTDRADGWRTFRIEGVLDFSLIGILSEISKVLAENKIGIFVVSTYKYFICRMSVLKATHTSRSLIKTAQK